MDICCTPFGTTRAGQPVDRLTMTDGAFSASVLTLGGVLQSLVVPDRNGAPTDVVLGFDTVADYEAQTCYIGALIGRCANRIEDGRVTLGGTTYALACNDGGRCHLHGGNTGFDRRIWTPSVGADGLTLRYHSPNGEEGYPGALDLAVTFRLENGALRLDYRAQSDRDTLCNPTCHAYFNLAGHASGPVGGQQVCVHAGRYTPLGDSGTATGAIDPVEDTPLDLRVPRPLQDGWDSGFDQIARAAGYDHNYLPDGGGLRPVAGACSPQSGVRLDVLSDAPGLQLYSGNFLGPDLPRGKGGAQYGRRHTFCLETQFPPNAPRCPAFAQPVLRAGAVFASTTIFQFSLLP